METSKKSKSISIALGEERKRLMFVVVTAEPELDVRRYLRKLDVRWFVGAVLLW